MSTETKLAQILGTYYNQEEDFYNKTENLLRQGITFNFTAPELLSTKKWSNFEWIEFILINLKEELEIISRIDEYVDLGHKLLLFSDETISLEIINYKIKYKMNLSEYYNYISAGVNLKDNLNFKNPISYEIKLSLKKSSTQRIHGKKYYLSSSNELVEKMTTDLLESFKRKFSGTFFGSYPKKYKNSLERIKLWGLNPNGLKKDDVKKMVDTLPSSDFGIKDITELYFFCHFFPFDDFSNKQFIQRVKKTLKARKNNQNKILKKYDK